MYIWCFEKSLRKHMFIWLMRTNNIFFSWNAQIYSSIIITNWKSNLETIELMVLWLASHFCQRTLYVGSRVQVTVDQSSWMLDICTCYMILYAKLPVLNAETLIFACVTGFSCRIKQCSSSLLFLSLSILGGCLPIKHRRDALKQDCM